ncbi:MAG: MgtC/SapB family protein [Anderseniella sp.]|jgi:uncharacterized membrane protein (DUF4010 family)|nr:MgtC/SapB family protein [Anderseniella sp.]
MNELELFQRLGLALAIGLLFGMERGWHQRSKHTETRVAGFRTFALVGLLGGLSGWLGSLSSYLILGLGFVGVAALLLISYRATTAQDGDVGITTEIAAMLTFVLGAAAVLGEMAPVAATAVVATALLASKTAMHHWLRSLRRYELLAGIELAIISVVLLPLLPDQGYGPGGVLNPYKLWWAVVLVAGLSFFGYAAMRFAGTARGLLITGALGGLASSTAATLALSRMAHDAPGTAPVCATSILLASAVTFIRILLLAGILNAGLAWLLAGPMLTMAAIAVLGAVLVLKLSAGQVALKQQELKIRNPLELAMALKFAAFLAAVMVAVHFARLWFGEAGLYGIGALSGLTDVDAITISMARIGANAVAPSMTSSVVLLAAAVNLAVKSGIVFAIAGTPAGFRVLAVHALCAAAGFALLWL